MCSSARERSLCVAAQCANIGTQHTHEKIDQKRINLIGFRLVQINRRTRNAPQHFYYFTLPHREHIRIQAHTTRALLPVFSFRFAIFFESNSTYFLCECEYRVFAGLLFAQLIDCWTKPLSFSFSPFFSIIIRMNSRGDTIHIHLLFRLLNLLSRDREIRAKEIRGKKELCVENIF